MSFQVIRGTNMPPLVSRVSRCPGLHSVSSSTCLSNSHTCDSPAKARTITFWPTENCPCAPSEYSHSPMMPTRSRLHDDDDVAAPSPNDAHTTQQVKPAAAPNPAQHQQSLTTQSTYLPACHPKEATVPTILTLIKTLASGPLLSFLLCPCGLANQVQETTRYNQ